MLVKINVLQTLNLASALKKKNTNYIFILYVNSVQFYAYELSQVFIFL